MKLFASDMWRKITKLSRNCALFVVGFVRACSFVVFDTTSAQSSSYNWKHSSRKFKIRI
jgi:hypothetical protein